MLRIWWIGTLPIWHIFDEIWWFDVWCFFRCSFLEVCWWVSWIWSVFLSSQAILRCEFCDAASFKSISQSSGMSLMILMVERKWQDLLLAMRTGAMAQSLGSKGNQWDKRFGIWSCLPVSILSIIWASVDSGFAGWHRPQQYAGWLLSTWLPFLFKADVQEKTVSSHQGYSMFFPKKL